MAKHTDFVLNQDDVKIALKFKKAVPTKQAHKLASLLFWIATESKKVTKHLKTATIKPS
jgi:hypothetical protein